MAVLKALLLLCVGVSQVNAQVVLCNEHDQTEIGEKGEKHSPNCHMNLTYFGADSADTEGYTPQNNNEGELISGFNWVTKKCEPYSDDTLIPCAPFQTFAKCREGCKNLESDAEDREELLEEAEEEATSVGVFIYHLAFMAYMCFALALVCEDFFVAALEILIEKMQLPPDVAGATFMAAGSSSPELFVATVAVFFSGDTGHQCKVNPAHWVEFAHSKKGAGGKMVKWDEFIEMDSTKEGEKLYGVGAANGNTSVTDWGYAIKTDKLFACKSDSPEARAIHIDRGVGVGAVVGSTMFNTMVIIGGSAIVSAKVSKLDWRIILRDGGTYMAGLAVLAYTLNYPEVRNIGMGSWFMNIEKNGHMVPKPAEVYGVSKDGSGDIIPMGTITGPETLIFLAVYTTYVIICAMFGRLMECCCSSYGDHSKIGFAEMGAATTSFDAQDKTNRPSIEGFEIYKNRQLQNRRTVIARELVGSILRGEVSSADLKVKKPAKSGTGEGLTIEGEHEDHGSALDAFNSKLFDPTIQGLDEIEEGDEEHGDGDHAEHHVHSIWKIPSGGQQVVFWALSFPLMFAFTLTIPDTRKEKCKKLYMLTFAMSIVWLGGLVELMVEHAQEAFIEGPPQMDRGKLGLTFVAAGTSLPDALASFLVAARGCADMAVSNAFGSNIFDILLGLGLPWCLQCYFADPGSVLLVAQMPALNASFKLLVASFLAWFLVLSLVRFNLAPIMGVFMVAIYFIWAGSQFL